MAGGEPVPQVGLLVNSGHSTVLGGDWSRKGHCGNSEQLTRGTPAEGSHSVFSSLKMGYVEETTFLPLDLAVYNAEPSGDQEK